MINFMNFSIAMIPVRVRGVNIRRILGADSKQLKWIMASESIGFILTSFVLSLVFIALFQNSDLKSFFQADISLKSHPILLAIILGCGLILGLLFSIFPARYTASFQPAMALSGSFAQSKRSVALRSTLITVQLFSTVILIVVAIFVSIQHNYMTYYSWGIQKENVLYVEVKKDMLDNNSFINELKKSPDIIDHTVSESIPGTVQQRWGSEIHEKDIWFASWIVEHNFIDFFGAQVIEGRNFIPDDDAKARVICNQKLAQEFEIENIVGCWLQEGKYGEFVGVVKDINFESLHSAIRPMCFITADMADYSNLYLFIKVSGNNIKQSIDYINSVWMNFTDTPCQINFLDTKLEELYLTEKNFAKIIALFGAITMLIAIMGIYGLIVLNAKYKAKEIAIRKINGASSENLLIMLNKTVLIQLAIAFIFATPASYFITQKWLEGFAYRTAIHWWVFLLAGVIILTITLLTVSYQTWMATNMNPTDSLKSE